MICVTIFSMKCKAPQSGTLLELLALVAPDSSKTTLRQWIGQGRILISGMTRKDPRYPVKFGEEISLAQKGKYVDLDIRILSQEKDFIVIDKPAGLLSVSTNYETERTAHSILKKLLRQQVYPVQRLDRETSGVMVFALSQKGAPI